MQFDRVALVMRSLAANCLLSAAQSNLSMLDYHQLNRSSWRPVRRVATQSAVRRQVVARVRLMVESARTTTHSGVSSSVPSSSWESSVAAEFCLVHGCHRAQSICWRPRYRRQFVEKLKNHMTRLTRWNISSQSLVCITQVGQLNPEA